MTDLKLFTDLRAYITTKLTTIDEIAYSDNEHHYQLPSYPAVTFEPAGLVNSYITTTDNKRGYSFDIYVQCEMAVGGRGNAVTVMCLVLDALIESFDRDFSLGTLVDFTDPLTIESIIPYENGDGPVLVAKLNLTAYKETQVNRL